VELIRAVNITLPTDVEGYIEKRVRSGAFASESEFVEAAVLRQMQEEQWIEQRVIEGLAGPVTPLTRDDLATVRELVRKARARRAA
jgi:Arc/MetJ-type ribon-helix-helix transcriptional regulator